MYDMMSFQKIYSPTQLANAMKLVRQQNGWTQSELAKKIGIKQATISNFENNPDNTTLTTFFKILQSLELVRALAVERFDRRWNAERTVLLRLPQEDMCQTFGLPSSVKYESDGGPGIARIMAFLMGSSEALKDRYDFMKFQVFQWLIGATDGHAKNFSVFIQAGGSYRLTPFYDIISAFPVLGGTGIHISDLKLAMGLNASKGKKTAIDKIYPRHFLATAKVLRFPEVQMHEILSDFARMIPAALDNVKTSLPTDFPENVVTAVESNVLRLHGRLSREYGSK
ncbi:TPA: type II toxin-antitoxin system antitoxin HipB [Escherichia coli]